MLKLVEGCLQRMFRADTDHIDAFKKSTIQFCPRLHKWFKIKLNLHTLLQWKAFYLSLYLNWHFPFGRSSGSLQVKFRDFCYKNTDFVHSLTILPYHIVKVVSFGIIRNPTFHFSSKFILFFGQRWSSRKCSKESTTAPSSRIVYKILQYGKELFKESQNINNTSNTNNASKVRKSKQ